MRVEEYCIPTDAQETNPDFARETHQYDGSKFLAVQEKGVLSHYMGTGKTRTALNAREAVCNHLRRAARTLILVNDSAIAVWERQIELYYPEWDYCVVDGQPQRRARFWRAPDTAPIYITTYAKYINDLKTSTAITHWDVVICDEAHCLRSRQSKMRKALLKIMRENRYVWFLTGTAVSRGAEQMWSYLNMMKPGTFGSYWRYVSAYMYVEDTIYGKKVDGVRNPRELEAALAPFVHQVTREQVFKDSGSIRRVRNWVRMTPEQGRLYDQLAEHKYLFQGDTAIIAANPLELATRQRQLLACARYVVPDSKAKTAALQEVARIVEEQEIQKAVVFTHWSGAIMSMADELSHYVPHMIGVVGRHTDRQGMERAIKVFQGSFPRQILIFPVGRAMGFSLDSANTAFFIQPSYVPGENAQAESRLLRMDSRNDVTAYYILYQDAIEDATLLDILNAKDANIKHLQTVIAAANKRLLRHYERRQGKGQN